MTSFIGPHGVGSAISRPRGAGPWNTARCRRYSMPRTLALSRNAVAADGQAGICSAPGSCSPTRWAAKHRRYRSSWTQRIVVPVFSRKPAEGRGSRLTSGASLPQSVSCGRAPYVSTQDPVGLDCQGGAAGSASVPGGQRKRRDHGQGAEAGSSECARRASRANPNEAFSNFNAVLRSEGQRPHLGRRSSSAMRSGCPFAHTEHDGGYWVASRYADVFELGAPDGAVQASSPGVMILADPPRAAIPPHGDRSAATTKAECA